MLEAGQDITGARLLARNLDFVIREKQARTVAVLSELPSEGNTQVLHTVAPSLCQIYGRKILILHCQTHPRQPEERGGVDYLSLSSMSKLAGFTELERLAAIKTVLADVSGDYDVVFLDFSIPHRVGSMMLPEVQIDGALMVRSAVGISNGSHEISDLLLDKKIPVLGVVLNEGVV